YSYCAFFLLLLFILFFFSSYAPHLALHSFPTRRSSDLWKIIAISLPRIRRISASEAFVRSLPRKRISPLILVLRARVSPMTEDQDRKSTRLNSSHDQISYAVFCLKKKNRIENRL